MALLQRVSDERAFSMGGVWWARLAIPLRLRVAASLCVSNAQRRAIGRGFIPEAFNTAGPAGSSRQALVSETADKGCAVRRLAGQARESTSILMCTDKRRTFEYGI